jgi:hypothetical protein
VLITSANITDGTIVDADVNASAAIAGTKISPNFGSQNVVTTGTSTAASLIPTGSSVPANGVYLPAANSVGISTNSVQRVFIDGNATVFRHSQSELGVSTGRPYVQLHSNLASSQFASYAAYNWVNGSQEPGFNLYKSRSGTIGTNAIVSNGDNLGRIGFHGDTGAEFVTGADILSQVDGVPSGTSMPGRLLLRTTPSGSTVPTERVRITSDGRLGLGTSSPDALLTVNGIGAFGAGAVTTPSIAATGDLNTGFWFPAADTIAASTNGTEGARIDSSGRLLVGTSSNSGGALLQINGNRIRIATANTPASASATGTTGEIAWDANYIYVCTATNTWKRTAISTW